MQWTILKTFFKCKIISFVSQQRRVLKRLLFLPRLVVSQIDEVFRVFSNALENVNVLSLSFSLSLFLFLSLSLFHSANSNSQKFLLEKHYKQHSGQTKWTLWIISLSSWKLIQNQFHHRQQNLKPLLLLLNLFRRCFAWALPFVF